MVKSQQHACSVEEIQFCAFSKNETLNKRENLFTIWPDDLCI